MCCLMKRNKEIPKLSFSNATIIVVCWMIFPDRIWKTTKRIRNYPYFRNIYYFDLKGVFREFGELEVQEHPLRVRLL